MRPVRASEIGTYVYCRRAWWYQRQGLESANQGDLAAGTELHRRHGRQVLLAGLWRALALISLLTAIVLLTVYFTLRLL
jgi:CRISPR/Cas system-associated exonuclease Cas4 (RecB family)